ncbi:MAG: hypothetical protein ACE5DL_05255 [Nitrosopumilaceae archaeon]
MASKKGIIITIVILVAITAGSFLFWLIPQDSPMSLVISDHENYLDGVKEIHSILDETISTEFENLKDEKISPDEYIQIADVTSSQITSKVSEFVTSKPTEEWQDSYINYMDAMKKFNEHIVETEVLANLIENEGTEKEMAETLEKIESLKAESIEHAKISDELRPD